MNWEKEVISRLKNYNYRKEAITNLKSRIRYIESNLTSVKTVSIDKDPIKGGGSKQEDILINNIVEKDLLLRNLKYCQREVEELDKAFEILTNTEYQVIQKLYLVNYRINLKDICNEMGYSKSNIYNISHVATKKLALYLYGKLMTE
ncbi:DUF1492 domain-containing protein [Peptoniphilus senegalensis]|uniref:DUF1492 domain-containing protein n=1 Tax=Peptoniphilus senegalensis TaxID=1465757 RepID=UPI0002E54429|nr:DUF1492 domain-containing protein [Peptoniphilus senegalensis]